MSSCEYLVEGILPEWTHIRLGTDSSINQRDRRGRGGERRSVTLSTLSKKFSRQHIEICFYFIQKTGFDISCKLSPIPKPDILKCHLLCFRSDPIVAFLYVLSM